MLHYKALQGITIRFVCNINLKTDWALDLIVISI